MSEQRAQEIATSPEAAAFLSLYGEWKDHVVAAKQRGVPTSDLQEMAARHDAELGTVLFGNQANVESFSERKQAAIAGLMEAYPELAKFNVENESEACKTTDPIITRNIIERAGGEEGNSAQQRQAEVPCGSYWQTVKLLACAAAAGVVCSEGGPGGVLFCGWGCWCMLCPDSATGSLAC